MKVGVCAVGDAFSAGDLTTSWLARRLAEVGLDVAWHVSVGDRRGRIVSALRWLLHNCAAIVTVGGPGQERSDLAWSALAEAAGVAVGHAPHGEAQGLKGRTPLGAVPFEPIGSARGFVLETARATGGSAVVYVVSGTSIELRMITERDVLPDLARRRATTATLAVGTPDGEERLEEIVARLLHASGLTVATAESCTAGAVATRLAAVPGASAYLRGGIVAYAANVKASVLGLDRQLLGRHGPVSIQTTVAMARRAWQLFDADLGLGVTCVAGPDVQGGRSVGTTIWALATREGKEESGELEIVGDRPAVQARAAAFMLEVLSRHLLATRPPGGNG